MSNQWTLKILSGAHNGAEIPLDDGTFTIGTGEHCDLVLQDDALGEDIGSITISEDGVTFYPKGYEETGAEPLVLTSNKAAEISGLSLGVVPYGEDWTGAAEEEDSEPALESPETTEEALVTTAAPELSESGATQAATAPSKGPLWIAGVAMLAALGLGSYLWLGGGEETGIKPALTKDNAPRIPSSREQGMLSSVKISLSLQKMPQVKATIGKEENTIVLEGYVEVPAAWKKVKHNLKKDIRGVKSWVDRVDTKEDRVAAVRSFLEDEKIDTVHVKGEPGSIAVMGSVPANKVNGWEKGVDRYDTAFDDGPPLKAVKPTKNTIQVMAINLGDPSHIVTRDGKILLVGAELERGVTLAAIHEDKIVLKKNNMYFTQVIE